MQYFKADKISEKLDISKATLYRYVRARKFNPPIKLSSGTSVWPESDIDDFIAKAKGDAS